MSDRQYQKMCIFAVPDPDHEEGFTLQLIPENKRWWMNEQDVCVGMTTVTYDPPENMSREEMALKAVETLRDRIKQTQADAQMKINKLQKRIDDLLLLTHQPQEEGSVVSDNVVNMNRSGTDDIPF